MKVPSLLIILLALCVLGASCKEESLRNQANSWRKARPNVAAVNLDWEDHVSHDRWLEKVEKNTSEQSSLSAPSDDKANKITKGERLARYIVYWITLGFFLDLAIYFARFDRTNPNHDEFHAALMILCFAAGLSMDIWFLARQYGMLFNGVTAYDVYFGLICATNAFAIPQLIYGNIIRFKMRDAIGGTNYLSLRRIHKPLGIIIYLLTKAKFFYLHEVEQLDLQLFPTLQFDLRWIFVLYLVLLVIFWTVLNMVFFNKPNRFRDKVMKDNTGHFSTAQKTMHNKLLDLRNDGTLDQDNLELYKDCIWVMFEDRVFDVTNLDHPGGRFILSTVKGKEISRFMVGGLEYNDTDSKDRVYNRHSPFALNLLETMFIGFVRVPNVLIRYDLVQDNDITVMGLKKLVQLKDDRKKKMVNDSFQYDFSVSNPEVVTPTIDQVHLKSSTVEICLSENPFQLFGKYFNVRIKDWKGLSPFSLVLSRSENFVTIKKNILAHFHQAYPSFGIKENQSLKAPVDVETFVKRTRKTLRKSSTHEHFQQTSAVSVVSQEDIKGDSVCLLLKAGSNDYARKMKNSALNTTIYDLKGPFGQGFGLSRFAFGGQMFFGSDTGVFSYLDFIDYLCRFYIYRYAQAKSPDNKALLSQLDPFSDDFGFTFNNQPVFYFFLDFDSKAECEALVKNDLCLLRQLEDELKLGLIGGISIRLQKAELNYEAQLPGIGLSKVTKNNAQTVVLRLEEIGVKEKGSQLDQKVEKAIMAGSKDYLRDLREGLIAAGVSKTKFKSL